MSKALRRRFWLETSMATLTSILFVITLLRRDWLEIIFNIDPDSGSGALEWLIVGALLLVMITVSALASYEWRRARTAIS